MAKTVDLDEIRIALEIAGGIVNGSTALTSVDEDVRALMREEEIDDDRYDVVRTLVRSFYLFGRNVGLKSTSANES